MSTEFAPDVQESPKGFKFAARKVRLGREFYVEAMAPDRRRYRIGSFKFRGRAQDWIVAHAAAWQPEHRILPLPDEQKAAHSKASADGAQTKGQVA